MYIPFSYLGPESNLCISASGGDETGEFISGSTIWKYHKYETTGSASFTIHSGFSTDFRVFLVGGGGGGGLTNAGGGGSPQGAGGGGGGGIVYTDFRFGTGTHSLYVGNGGTFNQSGEATWLQVGYEPSDYEGYFPIQSQLTADGGGRGAFLDTVFPYTNNAQGGGSGGGAARGLVSGQGYFTAVSGGGRNPQGTDGGKIYIPTGGSTTFEAGAGGGGAAESGSDANFNTSQNTAARGGNGLAFNVDGTVKYYGAGGGGRGEVGWPSTVALGSNNYGAGGSGSNDNAGGNPGTINGHDKREGRQGVAVIMYPVCQSELLDCTTYTVNGGASGGTVTYWPCGGDELVSSSLVFDQQSVICTYVIGDYPQSTGTVTLTPTGSCDTEIPITPVPTCDTGSGEVTTPTYIYNWEIPQACYPTNESCQTYSTAPSTLYYVDRNGNSVTQSIGGGIGGATTGQICAREEPTPYITCGTVGNPPVASPCTLTKTDLICGYYCSGSL